MHLVERRMLHLGRDLRAIMSIRTIHATEWTNDLRLQEAASEAKLGDQKTCDKANEQDRLMRFMIAWVVVYPS